MVSSHMEPNACSIVPKLRPFMSSNFYIHYGSYLEILELVNSSLAFCHFPRVSNSFLWIPVVGTLITSAFLSSVTYAFQFFHLLHILNDRNWQFFIVSSDLTQFLHILDLIKYWLTETKMSIKLFRYSWKFKNSVAMVGHDSCVNDHQLS